jgi:O-acetyl-ADP-ribose deacetylase (regulator of RNase III)
MFPNDRAAEIAVGTVKEYLDSHEGIKKVVFNVFKDVDLEIYEKILMR